SHYGVISSLLSALVPYPTRRSSDLKFWAIIDQAWNSNEELRLFQKAVLMTLDSPDDREAFEEAFGDEPIIPYEEMFLDTIRNQVDRKSTRLNSSHVKISYAVFCLKK